MLIWKIFFSLIRTFIHGYCGVSNMKLNIWLDIFSKYIEFLCHCSCCCGHIFRKINWYILSGFFPLVCSISLAMVKTDVKNVLLKMIFFPELGCNFFIYLFMSFTCYELVRFCFQNRKPSIVFWVLDCSVLCLEVTHADAFIIPLNFFRSRYDFVLLLQTLELVQTKNNISSLK